MIHEFVSSMLERIGWGAAAAALYLILMLAVLGMGNFIN